MGFICLIAEIRWSALDFMEIYRVFRSACFLKMTGIAQFFNVNFDSFFWSLFGIPEIALEQIFSKWAFLCASIVMKERNISDGTNSNNRRFSYYHHFVSVDERDLAGVQLRFYQLQFSWQGWLFLFASLALSTVAPMFIFCDSVLVSCHCISPEIEHTGSTTRRFSIWRQFRKQFSEFDQLSYQQVIRDLT